MNTILRLISLFSFIILSQLTSQLTSLAATKPLQGKELLGNFYDRSPASRKLAQPMKDLLFAEFKAKIGSKHRGQSKKIAQLLISESKKYNLDPVFVLSIIKTESYFNADAIGGVGEVGLMQIRPETAQWIAEKYNIALKGDIKTQLKKPMVNITIGTAYLSYLRDHFKGEASMYLPAYNSGPKKVRQLAEKKTKPKQYALKVMKNYSEFYGKWTLNNRANLVVKN